MSLSQGDLPPQQTTTKNTPATSSSVTTTSFISSSYSYSSPYPTSTHSIGNNGSGGNGGGGDGGDVPVPKNASYFFGFLVTFVILLLSFVGCGFGSRRARRGAAGRFRLDDDDDVVDGNAAAGAQRGGRRRRKIGIGDKPVLWDAWIAKQKGAAELPRGVGGAVGTSGMMTPVIMPSGLGEQLGWIGIEKPISAMFIHLPDPSAPASSEKPVPPQTPSPPTMTSAATIMTLSDRPSFWASYLHATVMRSHRHVNPTTTPISSPPPAYRPDDGGSSSVAAAASGAASDPQGAQSGKAAYEPEVSAAVSHSPPPPEEVQLSVMIAMPCPPHLRHPHSSSATAAYGRGDDEERELGEYQLGVLRVPWDHDHEDEAIAFTEKR